MSAGGETNEEKISKQADLLSEQVPKAFNIKVSRAARAYARLIPFPSYYCCDCKTSFAGRHCWVDMCNDGGGTRRERAVVELNVIVYHAKGVRYCSPARTSAIYAHTGIIRCLRRSSTAPVFPALAYLRQNRSS